MSIEKLVVKKGEKIDLDLVEKFLEPHLNSVVLAQALFWSPHELTDFWPYIFEGPLESRGRGEGLVYGVGGTIIGFSNREPRDKIARIVDSRKNVIYENEAALDVWNEVYLRLQRPESESPRWVHGLYEKFCRPGILVKYGVELPTK